ncbi:hypothetical protein TWF481_010413 [Arthrobotrys musiformis]|uniref:Uncharacterized protein n=1 Tax=Arthrobotrys musiformis TaxID=47236 RepID=A0AAV9W2K2_9PEZI
MDPDLQTHCSPSEGVPEALDPSMENCLKLLKSIKEAAVALLCNIKDDEKYVGVHVAFCSGIFDWIKIVEQIISTSRGHKIDRDIVKYIYDLKGLQHGLLMGRSRKKNKIPTLAKNSTKLSCLEPPVDTQISPRRRKPSRRMISLAPPKADSLSINGYTPSGENSIGLGLN